MSGFAEVNEINRSSHIIDFGIVKADDQKEVLFTSDHHWDNPKADLGLLTEHLQEAKNRGALIVMVGDIFCLMQGRYDGRRIKGEIRPEHNHPNYFDRVIDSAAEYYSDYAENIALVAYGNHETGIIRNIETDPLQRFVDRLNWNNKTNIKRGGYGGFITFRLQRTDTSRASCKAYYYHGSGGGGPVTGAAIQMQRRAVYISDADFVLSGHIHDSMYRNFEKIKLSAQGEIQTFTQHHIGLGCYKPEIIDKKNGMHMGWWMQRGGTPRSLGYSAFVKLQLVQRDKKNVVLKSHEFITRES
jgi:hypothetical protein